MAAAGVGVQPVEGRWSAAQWSGDPAQPRNALTGASGAGVWSGDPNLYSTLSSGEVFLKRAQPLALVRTP
jgi:hypothetical protein